MELSRASLQIVPLRAATIAFDWFAWCLELSREVRSLPAGIRLGRLHCNFHGADCMNLSQSAGRAKRCCPASMTYLTDLIEALRGELQQHGEMLARCDDAESPHARPAAELAGMRLTALHEQERVVELARRRREEVQRRLARQLCVPDGAGLAQIIPLLPQPHQLLVRALADENQELSVRLRQRTKRRGYLRWAWLDLTENGALAAW